MAIAQLPVIAERTARTIWEGSLATGKGSITSGSGALGSLPVTWAARTKRPDGMTSPEELAAAAHASCFSMALALRLGEHGVPPQRLDVTATVSLDEVDGRPTIVSSVLQVVAQVKDVDRGTFDAIVGEAAELCPISRLFTGAAITIDASLEGS
ncbi:MAG TPA: OsmC family peroxiredoxin [Candidatus Limnocylindrales bacterium]|nr:OsmC family peroxiredoxin [Candidatus Limnocylindrales bacterium]